jgi:hypothetical protein
MNWNKRYANELPRDPSEELPLPLNNREMEKHLIEDHSDILTEIGNLNWDLRKKKILDKVRKMTFEEKQKHHRQLHGPMGGFTHGTTHEHEEQ